MKIKPFKLERYYTTYEHAAKYSLCNSDCEAMTIKDLLSLEDGAEDRFHNCWLGYTETKGNPQLRENIADLYSHIDAENITVCTGAQEPIFLISHALLSAGDEVVVQSPCYQSLQSVPESIACNVAKWQVRYEGARPSFAIDDLKKLLSPKTKAIYLNAPHNPTGYLFTQEEQKAIITLARANDCIILCDEVYKELEYCPEHALPAFADVYERAVSIGVMSKSYGLPGLRIGWVATQDQTVLAQLAILKEYTTICNAAPSEFLAGLALRNRTAILNRNLNIVLENLSLYEQFFAKYTELFSWHKPHAGPVTFVKLLGDKDDMAFAKQVLAEQSVLLLPGGIYDFPGFFRIGFGRRGIPEALAQFEDYVVKNHTHIGIKEIYS